ATKSSCSISEPCFRTRKPAFSKPSPEQRPDPKKRHDCSVVRICSRLVSRGQAFHRGRASRRISRSRSAAVGGKEQVLFLPQQRRRCPGSRPGPRAEDAPSGEST